MKANLNEAFVRNKFYQQVRDAEISILPLLLNCEGLTERKTT